jgi:hypothetical protein
MIKVDYTDDNRTILVASGQDLLNIIEMFEGIPKPVALLELTQLQMEDYVSGEKNLGVKDFTWFGTIADIINHNYPK